MPCQHVSASRIRFVDRQPSQGGPMSQSLARRYRHVAVIVLSILLICSNAPRLAAQTSGATLTGRVVDQTGAGVPGATVTATAPATGLARSVVTEADGIYVLPSLPVGTYDVAFMLSGFKTAERKQVELNVASTLPLDVPREVHGMQA